MQDIKSILVEILSSNSTFEIDKKKMYENEELELDELGINSLSFLKIIVAIEQQFDMEFDDDALEFFNFISLHKLSEYIERKLQN